MNRDREQRTIFPPVLDGGIPSRFRWVHDTSFVRLITAEVVTVEDPNFHLKHKQFTGLITVFPQEKARLAVVFSDPEMRARNQPLYFPEQSEAFMVSMPLPLDLSTIIARHGPQLKIVSEIPGAIGVFYRKDTQDSDQYLVFPWSDRVDHFCVYNDLSIETAVVTAADLDNKNDPQPRSLLRWRR